MTKKLISMLLALLMMMAYVTPAMALPVDFEPIENAVEEVQPQEDTPAPSTLRALQVNAMYIGVRASTKKVPDGVAFTGADGILVAKSLSFTIEDIEGNETDGYTTTVIFHFNNYDTFEKAAGEKLNNTEAFINSGDQGSWKFYFTDKYPANQSLTFYWVTELNESTGKVKGSWKIKAPDGSFESNITTDVSKYIQAEFKLESELPKVYTVTYTDPFGSFPDQVYKVTEGENVPAFRGTPEREGYVFSTWNNIYKDVTDPTKEIVERDRIFSARWAALPKALDIATAKSKTALRITDNGRFNGNYDPRNVSLIDGTYTVGESTYDAANKKMCATVIVNKADLEKYGKVLSDIEGYTYHFSALGDRAEADENGNLVIHLASRASYAGSEKYKNITLSFGGWLIDYDYYPGASRPQLLFDRYYTVTYADGANGAAFADMTAEAKENSATPRFTGSLDGYTGWVFSGWTPAVADKVTGDATYTAKWKMKGANTLYYYGNGGATEGKFSSTSYSEYTNAASITVKGNGTTGFVRDEYKFIGWNTEADGTGTAYPVGSTYNFEYAHNLETGYLYAQWEHIACDKHLEDIRVITEPTCTKDGLKLCRCTVCGKEVEAAIPALGHDHSGKWTWNREDHWKKCTRCGEIIDLHEHIYGEWKTIATNYEKRTCTVCGFAQYAQTIHIGGNTSTKPSDEKNPNTGAEVR